MTNIRTYSELLTLKTFEERFEYLRVDGIVGEETFGSRRYINQKYYTSNEYKRLRRIILLRDNGFDLGVEDHPINGMIIIHHMNPITIEDILNHSPLAWNPEYLISVSALTHKAIHFSDIELLPKPVIERKPNDTCPWRR
uniref:HNH endonuclease bacteriophage, HNH Endonuclease, DNA.52A n=1 Tax=Siphoviridae sp. ctuyW65 TaxID=2826508 RepID=A0A8S5QW32_9CAUD|nr:MAG TPA: HNH endonuclease bacteriophage, HNH Endonuclease, DNA.52A [Siphoviridae sp. ctuyW65]